MRGLLQEQEHMDIDGLNAGYASTILEQYLESPDSVPAEWRALFEDGADEVLAGLPGLALLLERARAAGGNGGAEAAPPQPVERAPAEPAAAPVAAPDDVLLGGVAAAMALVKAYRMHGHLAARIGRAHV